VEQTEQEKRASIVGAGRDDKERSVSEKWGVFPLYQPKRKVSPCRKEASGMKAKLCWGVSLFTNPSFLHSVAEEKKNGRLKEY